MQYLAKNAKNIESHKLAWVNSFGMSLMERERDSTHKFDIK
jgi:hypothetical protein